MGLITYIGSAVRKVINALWFPLVTTLRIAWSSSLLTPYASCYLIVGKPRHKDNLKRGYRFNVFSKQFFGKKWLKFYFPWLQRRNNWHTVYKNLTPGHLLVLNSPEDIAKRGMYQLGTINEVIPQIRNEKTLLRGAKVAFSKKDENTGGNEIIDAFGDLSSIAPIENCESMEGTESK